MTKAKEYDPVTMPDALVSLRAEFEKARDYATSASSEQITNVLTAIHRQGIRENIPQGELYNVALDVVDQMLAGEAEGMVDEETLASIMHYLESASDTTTL